MGLNGDKLGFVRATGYGRIRRDELAALLELAPNEAVYRSGVDNGVRSGQVVKDAEVEMKPGDTFSAGPHVVKGSQPVPAALRDELDGLRRSGFGGVGDPEPSPEGWRLRLRGLTLPGGVLRNGCASVSSESEVWACWRRSNWRAQAFAASCSLIPTPSKSPTSIGCLVSPIATSGGSRSKSESG